MAPAAVEGAERLALAASVVSLGALGHRAGIVVVPGASQGSLVLSALLRAHRDRLKAESTHWLRIGPQAPVRRRVFLGARGRVVLGLWGGSVNPYRIRDQIVSKLRDEAYGPRPLDFELLHKLAAQRAPLDFLEECLGDPESISGEGEERLRRALFEPRGQVLSPPVPHPDRPRAWLALEIAENMEPADLLERVRTLASGSEVRMAEGFLWDRVSIHHPGVQAAIKLSKRVSEGPEIWPAAPWVTPSGLFTRELGTPMVEWSIPIAPSTAIRFPKPAEFDAIVGELSDLLLQTLEEVAKVGA